MAINVGMFPVELWNVSRQRRYDRGTRQIAVGVPGPPRRPRRHVQELSRNTT